MTSGWYIFLNKWHQCPLRLTPPRPAPRRKAGDHAGAGVKTKFKFLLYPKQASVAFFFKFSWIKVALHPDNLENKFGHFSQNYSIIFVLDFHTCQGLAKAGATDPSGALASLRCSFSTPGQKKAKKRVEMFDLSKTRDLLNVDCQVFVNKNWRLTPNHMTPKPFACQIIFIFFLVFHIFFFENSSIKTQSLFKVNSDYWSILNSTIDFKIRAKKGTVYSWNVLKRNFERGWIWEGFCCSSPQRASWCHKPRLFWKQAHNERNCNE